MLGKIINLIKSSYVFSGLGIVSIVIIMVAGLSFLVKNFQNNPVIENESVLASVVDSALGENLTNAVINDITREVYILPVEETVAPPTFDISTTNPETITALPQEVISPSPISDISPSIISTSPVVPITFVPSNTSPAMPIAGGGGAPPPPVSPSPPPPAFDYSLSNSGNISVGQGSSASTTISAGLTSGATQAVSFSASGLPAGATASFSSLSCSPNCSTIITISTASTTPIAVSTITVTASPSNKTNSFTLTVNDVTPPNLSFTLTACSSSIATNGCLLYSGSGLTLSWSSTSTDLADYSVTCSLSGATCSGYNLSNISYTSTTTNLSTRGLYTLTFSARDTSNNTTSTSTQLEINPVPIVINEVAWMGTTASTAHEWAELYNTSSYTINLGDGTATSWNLVSQDSTPSIYLNGSLSSGAYFVLERNTSATSYTENQTFTDAIDNPSGSDYLYLKNPAGTTLDYASASFAGSNSLPRKTMERINPLFNGDNLYNWRTYAGAGSTTYTDSSANPIYGTPGTQNSVYNITNWQPTYVPDSTVISSNTAWTLSGSPFVLQSNCTASSTMTIDAGSTLTLEPGVVVMAKSSVCPSMAINGTLIAEGTPSSNIIFTTLKDATYGGTGSAVKGSWARLIFSSTATNSSLKYLKYRYGGFYSGAPQPAVEVDSAAAVTFDTVTFEESQGSVFMLSGAGFTSMTIQNSIFQNNGDAPIKITSASPNILTNTATANTINGIFVSADSVFSANTTWGSTLPYVLESTGTARPTVALGTTLTINPGVILKPQSSANEALRIDGVLNWIATADNKGIITSYKDDADDAGGDTNGDGSATAPAVNDWKQIRFTNTTSGSDLSNIKLRYGSSTDELLIDLGVTVNKANVVSEP